MRIAFVNYAFEDRALTTLCFWLGRELVKRGHQATLVALSRKRRFRSERRVQDGVEILLTPRGVTGRWHHDGWGPHDVLTRLSHVMTRDYDVFAGYDFRPNVYLPFLAAKKRIPLRLVIWGDRWGEGGLAAGASRFDFQKRLEQEWERKMVLSADGVIASSQNLLELGRRWGVPESRSCWIPHGAPVDLVSCLPQNLARARLGMRASDPVIGYMGHTLEGINALYPSLRRLVRQYPRVTLLCIGGCSGAGKPEVEKAGLASHFRFTGFVPAEKVGDWLACVDFFLMPPSTNPVNDYYRYPGKVSDYMAAGRPIVAVGGGEAGRVVCEEKIGLLMRQDLADAEEQLCELIENKPLAEELGARARQAAEKRFAWTVLTDRLEDFLSGLAHTASGVEVCPSPVSLLQGEPLPPAKTASLRDEGRAGS